MAPRRKRTKSKIEEALATPAEIVVAEEQLPEGVNPEFAQELKQSQAMTAFKHKMLGVPSGLSGDAASKWADAELEQLLPVAVAELKDTLLHSSDRKQRMEAAKQVLDSTGRGKSERAVNNTPSIIINMPGGGSLHPWREVQGEVQRESNSDGGTLGAGSGAAK